MGAHGQVFKVPQLPVPGNMGIVGHKFFDSPAEFIFSNPVISQTLFTQIKGIVTIGPGFEKKYGREKSVFI
jgi:hypothetical protein